MKKLLLAAAALPLALFAQTSTPDGFTDNLDEAMTRAGKSGKYVFACFSGSDWCGWCVKLEKEVFSRQAFVDGVTNDFELVFIDSPHDSSLLSPRAKAENPKLVEKYRIEGFPIAIVFDSEGRELTRTGYQRGGAKKYAAHLMKIRAKGPALLEEAKLAKKHIEPFQEKLSDIARANGEAVEAFVKAEKAKGLSDDAIMAKVFAADSVFVKDFLANIEAAIAEFEKADLPAEVHELRSEEVENARTWVDTMRRELEKRRKAPPAR